MAKPRKPKAKRFRNWKCPRCTYTYSNPLPLLEMSHWCLAASPSKYVQMRGVPDDETSQS